MFVVLRVIEPETGYFKRRKQIKSILHSPVEICRVTSGLPFCTVDIIKEKRGINWNIVAAKCGRYASRIVVSKNVTLPDIGSLRRFKPSAFSSNLVFNTAKSVIRKAKLAPDSFVITVTDRNGTAASRICELLPLCSAVRVITCKSENYAFACENALENYGATLILRSSYESTRKPDIVISCDGAVSAQMSECAVFTFRKKSFGRLRLVGDAVSLTNEHTELVADDIDPLDFAGALTELCGCNEYSEACFSQLESSCRLCDNRSPEVCLKCFVSSKAE